MSFLAKKPENQCKQECKGKYISHFRNLLDPKIRLIILLPCTTELVADDKGDTHFNG
jgi:hypothetical protein